jgi:CRISPR-associated Cas5-like protein
MYALRLHIRPTSGLTFRRVPFSTREMLTYPFVPPTTLSGFVARLARLARGEDLPEASNANPEFVVLPRAFHALGALPFDLESQQLRYKVHSTVRQGVRSFDHAAFSRIWREKDKFTYQLYRWEYLFAEMLIGYIAHEDEGALMALHAIQGWGCKLGKEGWAFIENVEGPFPLTQQTAVRRPTTVVPMTDRFVAAAQIYPLYRYAWAEAPQNDEPIAIQGFVPLLAAMVDDAVEMEYFSGPDIDIPAAMFEFF